METIGDRLRMLRRSDKIKMSMEKFGERLGVGKTAISKIELGENALTDQMKLSICREFGVDQHWLETGEGDMFTKMDVSEELADLIARLPNEPKDSFKKRFFSVLARLSEDQWVMLADIAERLAEEEEAENGGEQGEEPEDDGDDRTRLHAELDRQLDLEEEAEGRSGVS